MKTKSNNNQPGIRRLMEFHRAVVRHQFDPLQFRSPIKWRAKRPKILGKESAREKRANDMICLKWLADKITNAKA